MIPVIIIIALNALSIGVAIAKHGTPLTGKFNVWTALIATGIQMGVLAWGGFLNPLFGR